MHKFDKDKFLDYLESTKLNRYKSKDTCDTYVNDVLVKNVPFKPHEVKGEETFNLSDLHLIYNYIDNHPKEKEIDFNKIRLL